jgi:uncharacterized protein
MDSQLEILLEIQDLQAQKRALGDEALADVEEEVFELRPAEALEILDGKIEELTDRLDPDVRRRWREVTSTMERAVVPVLNGICYGCFVAIPTAWSSKAARNEGISTCDHCGRFLYYVD